MVLQSSRPWLRESIVGWILYDVASSGYILMIPGVAYAVYFRQVVCGAAPGCDALWGMLIALSLGVAGVLSPVLGAIADLASLRHRLFVATTLLCCAATAGLYWVQPGAIAWGACSLCWLKWAICSPPGCTMPICPT
ncbi:MAG: MFS transporter [Leptolyngbyaceae cyanobacterium SM2_5_2]|nr:MFS transporter [Leptolyngbyaceae cyanobacterium SM2_5_2]